MKKLSSWQIQGNVHIAVESRSREDSSCTVCRGDMSSTSSLSPAPTLELPSALSYTMNQAYEYVLKQWILAMLLQGASYILGVGNWGTETSPLPDSVQESGPSALWCHNWIYIWHFPRVSYWEEMCKRMLGFVMLMQREGPQLTPSFYCTESQRAPLCKGLPRLPCSRKEQLWESNSQAAKQGLVKMIIQKLMPRRYRVFRVYFT